MDVSTAGRTSTGMALLAGLGLLAGCGGSAAGDDGPAEDTAPSVSVQAGGDAITVDPTQYCLDGDGQRYQRSAPILEVLPDTTISLTVSDAVAEAGWSVQVFDEKLETMIGEVDVPDGTTTFDQINTSDAAPPTFYLVVVEQSDPEACSGLSGAWPVGFIRTDGTAATTTPAG
jgi:ABC-type glycerol-3-phosphate transport system substrate-binding protein